MTTVNVGVLGLSTWISVRRAPLALRREFTEEAVTPV